MGFNNKLLKKRLHSLRMSQNEFAILMDTNKANVSRWIRGQREPTFETYKKICQVTKVGYDYYLNDKQDSEEECRTDLETAIKSLNYSNIDPEDAKMLMQIIKLINKKAAYKN